MVTITYLSLVLAIQLLPGFPQTVFFTYQLIALRVACALLFRQVDQPRIFLPAVALGLFGLNAMAINDIEPGKEYYTVIGTPNAIVLDGNLSEWGGVPVLADPKFSTPKGSGPAGTGTYVLFEEYNGGTWTGPDDPSRSLSRC